MARGVFGDGGRAEREVTFDDGAWIFRAGDPGRELYIVREGRVVITRSGADDVATLGPGDFFGEMSLLESLPREFDARASGPVSLRVLGPGALMMRLRRDPSFALEMLHQLSGRLRGSIQSARSTGTAPP